MKKLLQRIEYDEIEIDSPFFAYCQEEDKEIFIKITEDTFKQIISHISGLKEIFICRNHGDIANVWYRNKTNEAVWKDAVSNLKDYLLKLEQ